MVIRILTFEDVCFFFFFDECSSCEEHIKRQCEVQ